jgi:hypothetical protein
MERGTSREREPEPSRTSFIRLARPTTRAVERSENPLVPCETIAADFRRIASEADELLAKFEVLRQAELDKQLVEYDLVGNITVEADALGSFLEVIRQAEMMFRDATEKPLDYHDEETKAGPQNINDLTRQLSVYEGRYRMLRRQVGLPDEGQKSDLAAKAA